MSIASASLTALLLETPDPAEIVTAREAADVPGVMVVTLNRPEALNAMRLSMWQRLAEIFTDAGDARAIVIRGAGARAFSAGADIGEFPSLRMHARGALGYSRAIGDAIDAIRDCAAPVIAMVRGLAVGGGCEIAAACDIRIAEAGARFGVPITTLGVTLGISEARALVDVLGPAGAKHLVLSGRLVDSQHALRIGLIDVETAPGGLEGETESVLRSLAGASAATVRSTKRVIDAAAAGVTRREAERFADELFSVYEGPELREGVEAFIAKRPPTFAGTVPPALPDTSHPEEQA